MLSPVRVKANVVRMQSLALALGLLTGGVACGSRLHIPLDAPQYEDPVGPAGPAPARANGANGAKRRRCGRYRASFLSLV